MRLDTQVMPARFSYRYKFHVGCWSELLLCLHDVGAIWNFHFGATWKFHVAFSCRHEKSCRHGNGTKISCKHNFLMSGRYENQIAFVATRIAAHFTRQFSWSAILKTRQRAPLLHTHTQRSNSWCLKPDKEQKLLESRKGKTRLNKLNMLYD